MAFRKAYLSTIDLGGLAKASPPNDWLVSRAPTKLDENWPRREALECERAAKQTQRSYNLNFSGDKPVVGLQELGFFLEIKAHMEPGGINE